jgi:hypothetical protein
LHCPYQKIEPLLGPIKLPFLGHQLTLQRAYTTSGIMIGGLSSSRLHKLRTRHRGCCQAGFTKTRSTSKFTKKRHTLDSCISLLGLSLVLSPSNNVLDGSCKSRSTCVPSSPIHDGGCVGYSALRRRRPDSSSPRTRRRHWSCHGPAGRQRRSDSRAPRLRRQM